MVLQLRHVENKLKNEIAQQIDISDMSQKSSQDQEKARLSRSYAAYSLISLGNVEIETAVDAIVDSYDDNGIDAVYYDENENILWLVQSKWISSGSGEPKTDDVRKFVQGIQDLIELKFSKFNSKINNKKIQIENSLNNSNLKIKIILAYSGTKLGIHNQQIIKDFIEKNNEVSEILFFELFSLTEAHQALKGSFNQSINEDLYLTQWGHAEEPYQTFYGQISAENLYALWDKNKEKLFDKNIRSFIGLSDVNDGIKDTLIQNPENFLYFNNGITILCDKIQKKPMYGTDKSIAILSCEGISIVNGAQTVGTISNCYNQKSEQVKKAKVFIKLISLENCPSDFGVQVTKATNTQNKIGNRDFISLDNLQNELKLQFKLIGIDYHYKRDNNQYTLDDQNCTLEEATIALACSSEKIRYTVMAKDKIGELWKNIDKPPYTDLFNHNVKAERIWRLIKVSRILEKTLSELTKKSTGREKSTYVHGKRFILHMVFKYISKEKLYSKDEDFQNYLDSKLSDKINQIIQKTIEAVESNYTDKMVYSIFRKLENYSILSQEIIKSLPL